MHPLQSEAVFARELLVGHRRSQSSIITVKEVLVTIGTRETNGYLQHLGGLGRKLFLDEVYVGLAPWIDMVLDRFVPGDPIQVRVVSVYQNHHQSCFKTQFGVQDLHFRQAVVCGVDV